MLDVLSQPVDFDRLGNLLAGFCARARQASEAFLPDWAWEDDIELQLRLPFPVDNAAAVSVQPYFNNTLGTARAFSATGLADGCQQLFAECGARKGAERRITLVLPESCCLRKNLRLPAATRRHLREAGELQIEAETPFRLEDVYFSILTQNDRLDSEQLAAELAIARRETVDGLTGWLRKHGIEVSLVTAPAGYDSSAQHSFDMAGPVRHPALSLIIATASGCVLMAAFAAVIILPLHMRAAVATQEEERAAGIVAEAGAITTAVEKAARAETILLRAVDEKKRGKDLLPLLNVLSETIPVDSYIERLSYRNDQLQISGLSPSTSALIDRLSRLSQLTSPSYLTPVTAQNGKAEHFDLSFRLVPPPVQ